MSLLVDSLPAAKDAILDAAASESEKTDKVYGTDEIGRYRPVARQSAVMIVPGERVRHQWQVFLDNKERYRQQINFTDAQIIDFEKGWVAPLSVISGDGEYCGCKMTKFKYASEAINMNIMDIFDLAVNTNVIPHLFSGSTNSAYGGAPEVRTIYCGAGFNHADRVSFDGDRFPLDMYQVGMRSIAGGDINAFTMSLAKWGTLETLVELADRESVTRAIDRLARVMSMEGGVKLGYYGEMSFHDMSSWATSSHIPVHRSEQYDRNFADDLYGDFIAQGLSQDEAVFLIMLMFTQGSKHSALTLSAHHRELLNDDDFILSMLPLLRPEMVSPNARNYVSQYTPKTRSFDIITNAAEHDIDISLLDSMSA
jgi:hypothetical protein